MREAIVIIMDSLSYISDCAYNYPHTHPLIDIFAYI